MLGRGATSVVYVGTWRTTAVAVKEVVVQQVVVIAK
jgi:predicted Ser/Thr protein kinase